MLKWYWAYVAWKERVLCRLCSVPRDESGATVAEYALVLVLVSIAVIGVLGELGGTLRTKILDIMEQLGGATPGS